MIERVVVFGGKRVELAAEEDKFAGLEKRWADRSRAIPTLTLTASAVS
jgi:hypothetical protein